MNDVRNEKMVGALPPVFVVDFQQEDPRCYQCALKTNETVFKDGVFLLTKPETSFVEIGFNITNKFDLPRTYVLRLKASLNVSIKVNDQLVGAKDKVNVSDLIVQGKNVVRIYLQEDAEVSGQLQSAALVVGNFQPLSKL